MEKEKIENELKLILRGFATELRLKRLVDHLCKKGKSVQDFTLDPYEALIDGAEYSFTKADQIAQEVLSCSPTLENRITYLAEHVCTKIVQRGGNTYTTYVEFESGLRGFNIEASEYNKLFSSESSRVIIHPNDTVQLRKVYEAELYIQEVINAHTSCNGLTEPCTISRYIEDYENEYAIELHSTQKKAVITALTNSCTVVPGSAGTGKTTIMKVVSYCLSRLGEVCTFLAPTGKASRRLSSATGKNAYTCHLYFLAIDKCLKLDERERMHTLVIDEFSMVDTLTFSYVLRAMAKAPAQYTRIILVGDDYQLPSVGAGNVMADMLNRTQVPTIKLDKVYRQDGESGVLLVSDIVRNLQPIPVSPKLSDFSIECRNSDDSALEYILQGANWYKSKCSGLDDFYDRLQICTSTNKRAEVINKAVQKLLDHEPFVFNNKPLDFGIGDKVMCTENDYDKGIFNGEFGRVYSLTYTEAYDFTAKSKTVNTPEDLRALYLSGVKLSNMSFTVWYPEISEFIEYDMTYENINTLRLAYCTTIHKLQGSEFRTVVCDLMQFIPGFLDSRLLYTAITRARASFVLVSKNHALVNRIATNPYSSERKTFLFQH